MYLFGNIVFLSDSLVGCKRVICIVVKIVVVVVVIDSIDLVVVVNVDIVLGFIFVINFSDDGM